MDDPNPTTRTPSPDPAPPVVPPGVTPTSAIPPGPGPLPPPSVPPPAVPPPSSWTQAPHRDGGAIWSIVFGLILLGVGIWFFADRTLGLEMPDVSWGQLWPLILIGIGAVVLFNAMRRPR